MRDGEGRRARSRYGSSDPLLQRTRFDLYTIHAYIYIYTTRLHSTWYYLLNIIQVQGDEFDKAGVLRNILGRAVPVGSKPLPHYHLPRPPTSISTFLNSKEKPIRR